MAVTRFVAVIAAIAGVVLLYHELELGKRALYPKERAKFRPHHHHRHG
jgi:hypothetical protein